MGHHGLARGLAHVHGCLDGREPGVSVPHGDREIEHDEAEAIALVGSRRALSEVHRDHRANVTASLPPADERLAERSRDRGDEQVVDRGPVGVRGALHEVEGDGAGPRNALVGAERRLERRAWIGRQHEQTQRRTRIPEERASGSTAIHDLPVRAGIARSVTQREEDREEREPVGDGVMHTKEQGRAPGLPLNDVHAPERPRKLEQRTDLAPDEREELGLAAHRTLRHVPLEVDVARLEGRRPTEAAIPHTRREAHHRDEPLSEPRAHGVDRDARVELEHPAHHHRVFGLLHVKPSCVLATEARAGAHAWPSCNLRALERARKMACLREDARRLRDHERSLRSDSSEPFRGRARPRRRARRMLQRLETTRNFGDQGPLRSGHLGRCGLDAARRVVRLSKLHHASRVWLARMQSRVGGTLSKRA